MNNKWLKAFHAVATAGGFTAAAAKLNVGQPTVSAHVKALEDHYGVELFHRRGRTVLLTPVGQSLLMITRSLYGHEDEAEAYLRAVKELRAGQLTVSSTNHYVVMELIEAFRRRHPQLPLAVTLTGGQPALDSLLDFTADVAILARPSADARVYETLYSRSPVCVFVYSHHPWARRRKIRLAELEGAPVVMRGRDSTTRAAFERARDAAGVKTRTVMEINSTEAVREAVRRGLGVGVVSEQEFVDQKGLHLLHVEDAEMYIYAYLTCLAERRDRLQIRALFDIAEELSRARDDRWIAAATSL